MDVYIVGESTESNLSMEADACHVSCSLSKHQMGNESGYVMCCAGWLSVTLCKLNIMIAPSGVI